MINELKVKKISESLMAFSLIVGFIAILMIPDVSFAAASTSQVQSKLSSAATAIQGVLTGVVVVVGIAATLKVVVKHLPSLDDPHVKNEMWKSIGGILAAVATGAAVIWIAPWVYSLFS